MERATVIVAIPSLMDDEVYKISSEEVPHLTLLYLGNVELSADAVLYVQHAARELSPFGMSVDYRGTLGEDEADVLFFEKDWAKRVEEFRHHLLLNDEIKKAYDSAEQHPEWTPHLTLGYPEKPAREGDENRIRYVDFDRIAVWSGDFEGPEFRLRYSDYGMEVAMSDISTAERGENAVRELFHYGVKGMKWGVTRKDRAAERTPASKQEVNDFHRQAGTGLNMRGAKPPNPPTDAVVTQKQPGKYAKSEGGANHPLHPDAERALAIRQKARASKTDAVSNVELKAAVERMRLEQQYKQLEFSDDRRSRGQKFIQGLFGKRKPTKFRDMDEEYGEEVRKALAESFAMRKKEQDAA